MGGASPCRGATLSSTAPGSGKAVVTLPLHGEAPPICLRHSLGAVAHIHPLLGDNVPEENSLESFRVCKNGTKGVCWDCSKDLVGGGEYGEGGHTVQHSARVRESCGHGCHQGGKAGISHQGLQN